MSKFIVTFYDDDKETILEKKEVEKGEKVEYSGKTPEKAPTNGIEYDFIGWESTGNIEMVMEDINLYARYEESSMYKLSEENANEAKLNDVVEAGNKVTEAEKATRNMSLEEKANLVNEIMEKGSVDLDKENENENENERE